MKVSKFWKSGKETQGPSFCESIYSKKKLEKYWKISLSSLLLSLYYDFRIPGIQIIEVKRECKKQKLLV